MFEGLVRQLILGYLGQYIKDIQTEQLKITLWNEEVLLEKVELILEAFDYLRLPFTFKKGKVGKLSIRIPWKKLGWDPIIIVLEDIFISVCQRDDEEWCKDAVEKREFASKNARLAAAELAKLSRRVCDNQTGKSFISHITAKILDSIQVSIRNFHFVYHDTLTELGDNIFGLKFSSLTVTKRSPLGSATKVRGGQVNKLIEVQNLELYCNTSEKNDDQSTENTMDSETTESTMDSETKGRKRREAEKHSSILTPMNVIVSLSVNRSGKLLIDVPQYAISVELAQVSMSMDELQLQQILSVWDYMSVCQLREKYGRFRPWRSPLAEKQEGWQIAWWHYAQESVLSDVQKKLRKTSWKYFGARLGARRKYVNLYKTKLKCLRQDQVIEESVQRELEEMDKEAEIDDILNYRSLAERELEDFLVNPSFTNGGNIDKSGEDDTTPSKPRGWLNWLSYGMLGAGGTNDSSQFSGVISDEVIKDIYEATKFHPSPAVNGDSVVMDETYLSSMKINISEIRITLWRMELGQAIADLALKGIYIDGKVKEKFTIITTSVSSVEMLNPSNSRIVLFSKGANFEDNVEKQQSAVNIKVDLSTPSCGVSSSLKVIWDPVEVFCDPEFIRNVQEFFHVLRVSSFQQERIMMSLSGFDDISTRLLSKIDYVLSSFKKVARDINLSNITINIPLEDATFGTPNIVLEAAAISFASKVDMDFIGYNKEKQSQVQNRCINFNPVPDRNLLLDSQFQELYDEFEIQITEMQMKTLVDSSTAVLLIEKFNASTSMVSCILSDEPILKALEVCVQVPSLTAHFSTFTYGVVMGLVAQYNLLRPSLDSPSSMKKATVLPWISVSVSFDTVTLVVNLEDDVSNGSILKLYCQMLDIRYDQEDLQECWVSVIGCRVTAGSVRDDCAKHVVCLTGKQRDSETVSQDTHVGDGSSFANRCILLHYEGHRSTEWFHELTIAASDLDIHCYPYVVAQFVGFLNRLNANVSSDTKAKEPDVDYENVSSVLNIPEIGSYDSERVPLNDFPFSAFENLRSLCNLESIVNDVRHKLSKSISLKEQDNRQPEVSRIERGKILSAPLSNFNMNTDFPGACSFESDLYLISLKLAIITLHFHDSSSIFGTIMLPVVKSLISSASDFLDVICLTEGVVLSSPWWSEIFTKFLWGPSSLDLSPILNLHVKKRNTSPRKSQLDICFDIRHVSCMLPPEYLSMIIGYFSQPDWSSCANEQPTDHLSSPETCTNAFVFEIVDCNVIAPANNDCTEFLKANVKTLCITIAEDTEECPITKDIPSACYVDATQTADGNLYLDFSGRDLSLSFLVFEDSLVNHCKSISLISRLTTDVWLRIPCGEFPGASPTCIMAMIHDCQLEIYEECALAGFKALGYAIKQFSGVEGESKLFTSDVQQFREAKIQFIEDVKLLCEESPAFFTEMKFCVSSLLLRFHRSQSDSTSEFVAETKMNFLCSLSLVNDIPQCLDISFSSLALFSSLSSVVLAECACPGSGSSVLGIIQYVLDHGEQFTVSIPSLEVWLYMADWTEVINLLSSCFEQLSGAPFTEPTVCLPSDTSDYLAGDGPNNDGSANMGLGAGSSSLTIERVGLTAHFPALFSSDTHSAFGKSHVYDSQHLDENCSKPNYNQNCFFSVGLQIENSELVLDGETVKLTLISKNLSGMLKVTEGGGAQVWPIFQLSEVNFGVGLYNYMTENMLLKIEVLCDSLDFSFSNHTLYLLHFTWFEPTEDTLVQFYFKRMDFKVQLTKTSLLLTDWKTSSGPLLEFLVQNSLLSSLVMEEEIDGSISCDFQVNYYNIDKVLWEPLVEPWKFQLSMSRKHGVRALFNGAITTDINLESTTHLNINLNESIIEVISRAIEMSWDALSFMEIKEGRNISNSKITENPDTKRHAPYMLQNLTTLPLSFHVCGQLGSDDFDVFPSNGVLQPGTSVDIYISESPEELLFRYRPVQSSDRLNDKHLLEASHRYVTFQLEGTSAPSSAISMDLVGRRYFEVDFSKPSHVSEVFSDASTIKRNSEVGDTSAVATRGFAIPVVVDVSVQSFTKLIRLYSTVVILNSTSVPMEIRFDIPFGVSPKILGPIYTGQEFPLPLHLAESGCIRWRPCGDSYLWSEAYNISNIISQDFRIGILRSFVCYPSHPSSEAFRCCISVSDQYLPHVGKFTRLSSGTGIDNGTKSVGHNLERPKNRFLYQVMLTSPLTLKNYLMKSISLTLEYVGVTRAAFLSEVETSFFHVDSSHDLSLTIRMPGFRPSVLRFPRAESFGATAKFSGTKFCMSEVIRLDPEFSDGPLCVTIEKVMDAFSGARAISISVPFLLYNCTGFSLVLSNSANEMKGCSCIIPSCYNLDEKNGIAEKKVGLGFICSDHDLLVTDSTREKHSNSPDSVEMNNRKVTASLFSPDPNSYSGETMVKLSRYMPSVSENIPKRSWSAPFSLVPPTGTTSILVPQPSTKSASVISVSAVAASFSGKTKIITFEPRYVIANACSKNVCYKQKGTDFPFLLGAGQHSHIQWMDTTRELLLSVRFDEPGWEWSGCFLPEQLGDTQVKVRNYMSSAVNMVRVEVRTADVYSSEGKIVGSTSANSGTNLIVLFDDDTCFMPYRIDNYSRERLRVYQPKCESFETLIYPYTSSPYAWDEPCYPHRLIIEVPGERILGSYDIDDASVQSLLHLKATSEKPERNFLVSVHSEGAIKVLSITDSSYHVLDDTKSLNVSQLKDKRKQYQNYESIVDYKEMLSVDIPFLGISLMNSHPEELLFACAKNTKVTFVQSLDQQKFSMQIASFEIDNQLRSTPYPVLMSFNKGHLLNQMKSSTRVTSGSMTQVAPANSHEPVFSVSFSKWRNNDISLISFQSISVRISDFYLDIEQEIVLRLFEFCKNASSRLHNRVFQHMDATQVPLFPDSNFDEKLSNFTSSSLLNDSFGRNYLVPNMVPVGAPWQQIQTPPRKQKKIYIEILDMAPIKLTLSFSSSPWMLRHGVLTSGESLIHRGLMALADVEGAKIHFKQLILSHQIASLGSVQEILVSHYSRQFLHEMYKVFGSAGLIGNPMGFARSLGLGIKDFLSLPIWNVFQSPTGLITGMAQGTTSLLSNTVYAISDATSQFSKAAHKGIVAFTFDDHISTVMEKEQKGTSSQSKGVINEFLEGLTGVLQSPIKGAEKHGLPGVLSGIAVGVTGLVARPAASILEVTGKTAQSIRNRSRIHQMGHRFYRARLPRPLSSELPLKPYSWEEAIGTYVLTEADLKLMDETLVMCKSLKQQSGQYVLLTGRLILVVGCTSLVDVGKPQFEGVPADLKWDIQSEIALDSLILADNEGEVVHIVGSGSDTSFRHQQQQKRGGTGLKEKPWNNFHTPLPLFLTNLELESKEEADEFLRVLLRVIDKGKVQGLGSVYILHQSNTR